MIRKFNINPTIAPYLKPEWHGEIVISRVNAFNELAATTLTNEISAAHLSSQDSVIIVVDSYGGEVLSLASMLAALSDSEKSVTTIVQGKAMSCGAYLAGFGTVGKRYCSPDSIIMFHNMGWGTFGNPTDIKTGAEYFEKLQKYWCRKLAKHCGHTDQDYFLNLMKNAGNTDIYMTPKEAQKHKLIDHIKMPSIVAEITFKVTVE